MFSQTVEYALRAVIYLAQHEDEGAVDNRTIAEATRVPTSYLSKVLHDLAAAEILTSKRGVGGGFQLRPTPDELTVLDVVNAVDPMQRITGCPLKLATHCEQLCPMHSRLDEALATMEKTLANSTIRDMLFAPNAPQPLIETV